MRQLINWLQTNGAQISRTGDDIEFNFSNQVKRYFIIHSGGIYILKDNIGNQATFYQEYALINRLEKLKNG